MDKYTEMLRLSAQIEVLQNLPYQSVYKSKQQIGDLKESSAVMMEDVISTMNTKRHELAKLDGSIEIGRLKARVKKFEDVLSAIEASGVDLKFLEDGTEI